MLFSNQKRRALRDEANAVDVMKIGYFNELVVSFRNKPHLNLLTSLVVVLIEIAAVTLYFVSMEAIVVPSGMDADLITFPVDENYRIVQGIMGIYFVLQFAAVLMMEESDRLGVVTSVYGIIAVLTSATMTANLAAWCHEKPLLSTTPGEWNATTVLANATSGPTLSLTNQTVMLSDHSLSINGTDFVMENCTVSTDGSIVTFSDCLVSVQGAVAAVVEVIGSTCSKTTPFTPSFLRIWWAHKYLDTFIAVYFNFHPAIKEILSQGVFVTAIAVTSVGFYQGSAVMGKNSTSGFVENLYFVVVTVTTMGYGDINPARGQPFREGMVVVIVMIFVAMFFLPTLLSKFGEMTAYLESQNSYGKSVLHVIVYGRLSYAEMKLMLREFTAGSRKFSPLHIVMVSPEQFEQEVHDLVKTPEYRSRITLCVGDPLDRSQLPRFAARRADVIFAVSPRSAVAQRGDLDTILRSIAFRRHDPDLPQYLMLKRGSHATAVKRWAFALIERESLKYRLLGMALKLPGFVPFFLNLIKTTDQFDFDLGEQRGSWWKQYLEGMSNSLFTMPVPEVLEGRKFSSAALIILLRTGMVAIALVQREHKDVQLCPMNTVLRHRDRLVLLARNNRIVERCYTHFDIIGESFASVTQIGLDDEDGIATRGLVESTASTQVTKRPKRRLANVFPFKDHIVLIDISSSLDTPDLNMEENVDAARFQAQDMMKLLLPFLHSTNSNIVFLSRWDLSDEFHEMWPEHARPIYHVLGSGTDDHDLNQCCITSARGIAIFTSMEGDSPAGDSPVIMVQDLINRKLAAVGREKEVPVVVEVDDVSSLYMCNPKLDPSQSDSNFEETYGNYFLTPVFAFGGAISSAMLDTMVYQTYFNEFLPQLIDLLLFNEDGNKDVVFGEPAVNFFPPTLRGAMDKQLYADLFRLVAARGGIPFGLHRLVTSSERGSNLEGYRYFCTSPHPGLPLVETDVVYYLKT